MSRSLQGSELKYSTMEKQAYALVKSLRKFRTYVGYSKVIVKIRKPRILLQQLTMFLLFVKLIEQIICSFPQQISKHTLQPSQNKYCGRIDAHTQ